MFAPNASGKSTLLDALSFCLFDMTSRTSKAASVLNNKKKNFNCKVNFEVSGLNYYIERKATTRSRDGHVKVDVNFWMVDEGGDVISLNGDQRRTTNYNINRVIGTYDDFILSTLSTQNNFTVFIDKTQKERKELLATFMGTDIFDSLYQVANDKISETQTLLRDFNKIDYGKMLAELQKETTISEVKQTNLLTKKDNETKTYNDLNSQIINLTTQLKPVDDTIRDIVVLKKEKFNNEGLLNTTHKDESSVATEQYDLSQIIRDLELKVVTYESEDIQKKYAELEKLEQERDIFEVELDKLKAEVRVKLDKIDKLGNLKWDENCEYCMSNPFTLDAIDTKKNLNKDVGLSKEYMETKKGMDNQIEKMFKIRAFKEELDDANSKLNESKLREDNLNYSLQYINERKQNIENQIESISNEIQRYKDQENNIKYNKKIKIKITKKELGLSDVDDRISKLNDDITEVHSDIKVNDNEMRNINRKIKEIEELEKQNQAYHYYLDAVRRDSIPYELLEKAIPTIEGEVNNILSQLVDFQLSLEMDGKNINSNIVYDDLNQWPLELSSGMERFISSLAMRVGLINVSNLPRSNFLAIDEGWGTMDSDNINSVYNLFQYLKTQFQFALIVSHVDSMRDAVDTLLEISKDSDFSSIKFD
jgi:DNA repair exonuclease SbcCD ATPase subunit